VVFLLLVFEITDIAACAFLKAKIANGSYQGINTKGNDSKEEVAQVLDFQPLGFKEVWLIIKLPIKPKKKASKKRTRLLFSIKNNLQNIL
jgi:hypothetical protein